jgi:hypothetical protein
MGVNNFIVDEKNYFVAWDHEEGEVLISDVSQGCLDKNRNFVAVLPKSNSKNLLNIFDESGAIIHVFFPPPGFLFEYLLSDNSHGVRIICSGESERGDILDWYFEIDPSLKKLKRQGRAY